VSWLYPMSGGALGTNVSQLGIDAKQNIVNVYKKSQQAYKPIV